ncbi:MAG: GntR family transcriptional regulator [Candidatus Marinimicrobia bacterium]|nr:GntR family transcriptional regulator [Candidatus Neomarinimicrobiota bacterium]
MIDFNNPTPLYQQLADDIRHRINSGELAIGDKIGSQQELTRIYNVSPITVKKAIADLIRDGVLFSRVGKGIYVASAKKVVDYSKTQTIGFVLRDLNSPFFSRILESVERTASENKFNLLLANSTNQPEIEDNQIRHFLNMGVSGIVIASMSHHYSATPLIRQLNNENYPVVVVSYINDDDVCFIGTDHEKGGYFATEHLIKCGYKRIGYINGEEGNLVGELRKIGYHRALEDYKIQPNENDVYRLKHRGETYDYESGYEIGEQFITQMDRAEALFIYNDLVALGFQRAVMDHGLKVPEDVAIVGFDDIKRGITAPVPLTTIHQATDEIGCLAVITLIEKINNRPVKIRQILKPSLVIRDSCGMRNRQNKQP